jgi:hypothetical protein
VGLVKWYNHEHRHSAIRFVTPAQRHEGLDENLLDNHKAVYEAARAKHPQRWTGRVPVIGKKSKQSTLTQTRPKQKNATKEVIIQKTNQSEI